MLTDVPGTNKTEDMGKRQQGRECSSGRMGNAVGTTAPRRVQCDRKRDEVAARTASRLRLPRK